MFDPFYERGRSCVTGQLLVWLDATNVFGTWVSKDWGHKIKQVNKHLDLILTNYSSHLVLCFLSLYCDFILDVLDWKERVHTAPASMAARVRITGHGSSATAKKDWRGNTVKNVCKLFHLPLEIIITMKSINICT